MAKLIGNLRIAAVPASEGAKAHFEVNFVPYTGRLNTLTLTAPTFDDLVALLMELRLSEDDAKRHAGRTRVQGMVLVASFERADTFLREQGLLA